MASGSARVCTSSPDLDRLLAGVADGLPEDRPQIGAQPDRLLERFLVAVVEPGAQTHRSRRQIHVLRDEAGVDEVIGVVHIRIAEAGDPEPGLYDPEIQKSYYFVDTGLVAQNV